MNRKSARRPTPAADGARPPLTLIRSEDIPGTDSLETAVAAIDAMIVGDRAPESDWRDAARLERERRERQTVLLDGAPSGRRPVPGQLEVFPCFDHDNRTTARYVSAGREFTTMHLPSYGWTPTVEDLLWQIIEACEAERMLRLAQRDNERRGI